MIMGAQPFSGVLVRGSRRPALNIMRRRGGMGQPNSPGCMSSSDFYSAIGQLANCDPRDTSCVLCNQQRSDAVSNLVDSGCVAPGTPVSFNCDTSPTAVSAFMANNPVAVNATVGTGASSFVATGPTVTVTQPVYTAPSGSCPSQLYFGGVCQPFGLNTAGSGYSFARQQQQANPLAQQTTLTSTTPPPQPLAPQPSIINPSPVSQLAAGSSVYMNPLSALSQANGTAVIQAIPASTGDWFTDPTQEVISGLPNWALLVMGAGGLFMVVSMAARK